MVRNAFAPLGKKKKTVFTTKIFFINDSYFNNLTDKYPCLGNDKGFGKFKERYLIVYREYSICFQTNLL